VAVYSGGSLFAPAPRGDSVFLFSLKGGMAPVSQISSQTPAAPVAAVAPAAEHR